MSFGAEILPSGELFERIRQIDAEAPARILLRAYEFGQARGGLDLTRNGLNAFFNAVGQPSPDAFESLAADLAALGDDVRAAIAEYCEESGLPFEKIGLSADQWSGMQRARTGLKPSMSV